MCARRGCCSPPPPPRWAPTFERTTRSDRVRRLLSDPLAVTPCARATDCQCLEQHARSSNRDSRCNTLFSSRPTVHRAACGAHKWAADPANTAHHARPYPRAPFAACHSLLLRAALPVDIISPSVFIACTQRQPRGRPADGLTAELRDGREQLSPDRARPGRVERNERDPMHRYHRVRAAFDACHTPTTHWPPSWRAGPVLRAERHRANRASASSHHLAHACMREHATL